MQTITIRYDTIPLGRKNERRNISDDIADLLNEKYFCLDVVCRIKKINYDDYDLVPMIIDNKIDYYLLKKNSYDINDIRIDSAIKVLNNIY